MEGAGKVSAGNLGGGGGKYFFRDRNARQVIVRELFSYQFRILVHALD